ncbi:hydrogenase/urease maturation nickel metallochaperone HypA [Acidiphilium sp.]|uniref:hydrogenase/urease maturation nickel metallochaperone HypA n=1 Tax=Acidiphilium sp. TaxID=527 RepID=UPI00258BBFFF|nr:hydrogenase/urease maturation nickel metallochaperone HypA [Acidiphilium sp.]
MHETSLVRDLIRRIEQAAAAHGAARVSGVRVWLGALSHLSAGHLREHFVVEARGSPVEGARLVITESDDLTDPDAQHLRLESLDLEV